MDKNTKLAFILIFLVLIASYFLQPPKSKLVPRKEVQSESVKKEISVSKEEKKTDLEIKKEVFEENGAVLKRSLTDVSVETSLYKAVFTNRNGALKSFKLKKYKQREDSSKLVELIRKDLPNLSTKFSFKDTALNNAILDIDTENLKLSSDNNEGQITFSLKDVTGKVLYTKSYIFYDDKYSFDVIINSSDLPLNLLNNQELEINWLNGLNFTEKIHRKGKLYTNNEEQFVNNYYKLVTEKREVLEKDDDNIVITGNIEWAATRTKYFETFVFTSDKFSSYSHFKEKDPAAKKAYSDLGFSLKMENDSKVKKFSVFIGPMDQDILESYDKEFESTLNWGWDIVKPFAWLVLWMLKTIHIFISNYGLVIIILSILINLILTPFYVKSFKSSIAMKKIQPMVKEIQKKYKNDLQRQQQETMMLYKKHKVNPLGACLPTLLPMPVLYGMFIIFRSTIEFRGADFFGWITDLSLPEVMFTLPFSIPMYGENFGILPIIMGVFMYFQMKDSMGDMGGSDGSATSEAMAMNSKMMKYFMPVLMVVMFNNFASGLILYYTIGTVYRFFQMRHVKNKYKTA